MAHRHDPQEASRLLRQLWIGAKDRGDLLGGDYVQVRLDAAGIRVVAVGDVEDLHCRALTLARTIHHDHRRAAQLRRLTAGWYCLALYCKAFDRRRKGLLMIVTFLKFLLGLLASLYALLLLLVYCYQDLLVFPGSVIPIQAPSVRGVVEERLALKDGRTFRVAIARPKEPKAVVLWFVGNGEGLARCRRKFISEAKSSGVELSQQSDRQGGRFGFRSEEHTSELQSQA